MRRRKQNKILLILRKRKRLLSPFLAYSRLSKRGKFVIAVVFLSFFIFVLQYQFGQSGFFTVPLLAVLTDIMLFFILRHDLKERFAIPIFILPFFYSLAFGYFYFLLPVEILPRILITALFAFGLYSLLLCQNIFVIASVRTIALLSGARIVSFVLTLFTFFLLGNVVYSLHLFLFPTAALVFFSSFFLTFYSLWTYSLQFQYLNRVLILWALVISLCISEIASILWFWPSSPTIVSIFLTGLLYTTLGLCHVWFERRLFRGVLWEYAWVGFIVCIILISLTQWGK
ncbi:MAG: hypothetical protein HYT11_03200 [Candidatus Levybacteria bacterium]|nr:hypothetical protein [Candidatus Levybacteria bacterium]